MNFVELEEIGSILPDYIFQDRDLWETFDFPSNCWISLKETDSAIIMHWCPYPYPVSFEQSMQDAVKDLPEDAIVFYYKSNESFGVLRKCIM